jgi:protein MpaA
MLPILFALFIRGPLHAAANDLQQVCVRQMTAMPGKADAADINAACAKVLQLEGCSSVNSVPIYYFEKLGNAKNPKRIMAQALIHGDELQAGSLARAWMLRLQKIDPRNTWWVIPVINPDGLNKQTRMNANGVDLNRNFPTKDWQENAQKYWKKQMHSDPRRFPGETPASEVETKCMMRFLDQFKPDFVISVHTPLGVLDLDGPRVSNPPPFRPLPWTALGNFPGSLGRYMWVDRKIPVLTIELKGKSGVHNLEEFDRLQDISGTVAIQANQLKEPKTN